MGGQEIRSWARGLYTCNEIRFDLLRPHNPPYPVFPPSLRARHVHLAALVPASRPAIALLLLVARFFVLDGSKDGLWLVRAPS